MNTATTEHSHMNHRTSLEDFQMIIPCPYCASPNAVWQGDRCGTRVYICDECAKLSPELNRNK
jgi:transposase-like protein